MKRGVSLGKYLRPLADAPAQAYLSTDLQVPDILDWILDQVGESDVWQSTFSISEEYLRRLHSIREKGLIRSLSVMLDFKATNKTVDLWLFISQVIDSAVLADNHSKLILVRSMAGDKVCVVTSQNLTRGNRAESAFVCTVPEVFDTIKAQFDNIVKNKSIPLNDILRGTDSEY